jgi:hypothetical protein
MLPRAVQAASPRQSFDHAGAGAVLFTATGVCIGLGALIGWAAGSAALGSLGGAVVGIPAGIVAVYRRYRDSF